MTDLPELIDAVLDGTVTPADWRLLQDRLRSDPLARKEYRRRVNLHCALGRALAKSGGAIAPRPVQPAKFRKRYAVLTAIAAVAAAVALAVWLPRGAPPAQGTTLVHAEGGSELLSPGGVARPTVDGDTIPAGHSVRTAAESGPAVIAVGESRIELAPDTTARFDGQLSEREVFLPAGMARINAMNEYLRPLILRTPHAEIRASGTTFVSAVSSEATLVEVERGSLQFTRAADGAVVEVGPGAWAVTSAAGPMTAHPPFSHQATLAGTLSKRAHAPALSTDGSLLAIATTEGVELWSLADRQMTALLSPQLPVTALGFHGDGGGLAIGGNNPFIQLWDFGAMQTVAEFNPPDRVEKAIAATFAGEGRWLATTGHRGITVGVRVWDTATGQPCLVPSSAARGISVVAIPGGSLLAAGTRDGTVAIWDAATGLEQAVLRAGPREAIKAVAASTDGRRLAHPCSSGVALWKIEERRLERILDGQGRWFVPSVAFSPDGHLVAAGGPTDVFVWNAETGAPVATVPTRGGTGWLAFTADSRGLLTHSGGIAAVQVWNLPVSQ